MAYGIQVKLKNGQDMVTMVTPVFYLDFITWPESGSRSYNVPYGKTLRVTTSTAYLAGKGDTSAAWVSGNSVNWSNASVQKPVLVTAE